MPDLSSRQLDVVRTRSLYTLSVFPTIIEGHGVYLVTRTMKVDGRMNRQVLLSIQRGVFLERGRSERRTCFMPIKARPHGLVQVCKDRS